MDREYDVFEKLPDSSLRCLTRVYGTQHVPRILEERAKQTTNECFAMNIRTREIICRVNDKVARRSKLRELLAQAKSVKPVR